MSSSSQTSISNDTPQSTPSGQSFSEPISEIILKLGESHPADAFENLEDYFDKAYHHHRMTSESSSSPDGNVFFFYF